MRILFFAFAFIFATAISSIGVAQVNISNGTDNFVWTPDGNADFNTALFGDVMSRETWIVRLEDGSGLGDVTRTLLLDTSTEANGVDFQGTVNNGDNAVSTWNINGIGGAGTHLYEIAIMHEIGFQGNGGPQINYSIEITNNAGGINAPGGAISVFNYFDYDINGFANDTVTAGFTGPNGEVEFFMGDTTTGTAFVTGFGADAFEIREWAFGSLIEDSILASNTYNLTNGGTTSSDITAAMQWNATLGGNNGDSVSFSSFAAVPEPSSAMLLLIGAAGMIAIRRRRS